MRLLFSEAQPDYRHYIFPFAVWGFPEPGETAADLFNQGFLPSSRSLDRFYLCRQVRIALSQFRLSSENRRVLRKGTGISVRLIPRQEFAYTPERRQFYKTYADIKFGKDVMSLERLDSLFSGQIISHVLVFTDASTAAEVGTVCLYLEPTAMAYYYYAFYDLNYYSRNLGIYVMTTAVGMFAERGFDFLYLGTCYQPNALYKTQFLGAQFFNGTRWSDNLEELKYLLGRGDPTQHLLETEEYLRVYCENDLAQLARCTPFRVRIK